MFFLRQDDHINMCIYIYIIGSVVSTPLKNMSQSVGIMKLLNGKKVIKSMETKPPSSYCYGKSLIDGSF